MKNFFKYAMMFVAVVMSTVVISSCSKDDDIVNDNNTNNLNTPAHAADAMCLKINSASFPYSQVEFTESGHYILKAKSTASSVARKRFMAAPQTRSTISDLYGDYTNPSFMAFCTIYVIIFVKLLVFSHKYS